MKHVAIFLLFLLASARLLSQDTSKVSVTAAEINNGVVIVSVLDGTARVELHCNANMPSCKKLTPGKYTMVRLPKGRGVYECDTNVDMFMSDPQSEERIGHYCVVKSNG